jgi:hypothetical protein
MFGVLDMLWCHGSLKKNIIITEVGSFGMPYKTDDFYAFHYKEGELPIADRRLVNLIQSEVKYETELGHRQN